MKRICSLVVLVVGLSGCALLNVSSAERRAGTYRPGTEVDVELPSGKVLHFTSTGDDTVTLKDAAFGASHIGELTVVMQRSPVLKAQGDRAQMMETLLGQDVQLNDIWRLTWVQTMQEVSGALQTIIAYLKQSQRVEVNTPYGGGVYQTQPVPLPAVPASPSLNPDFFAKPSAPLSSPPGVPGE